MKRLLGVFLGTLTMLFGTLTLAAPAQAGYACDTWEYCGVIKNSAYSDRSLLVTYQWGANYSPNTKLLYAGQSSLLYGKDADGFYIPSGCQRWVWTPSYSYWQAGPLWVKVGDGNNVTIRLYC
jgi:hypothetical protein